MDYNEKLLDEYWERGPTCDGTDTCECWDCEGERKRDYLEAKADADFDRWKEDGY